MFVYKIRIGLAIRKLFFSRSTFLLFKKTTKSFQQFFVSENKKNFHHVKEKLTNCGIYRQRVPYFYQ